MTDAARPHNTRWWPSGPAVARSSHWPALSRRAPSARAAAGLPKGTCTHTLRHSYATHLLEEGVSIRLISAYLGHTSLETTLIYTHLTAVNEASARAAISRLLPPDNLEPPAAAVPVRR